MASGVVFDPMRLLRVAPLVSSTGSLVFATSELLMNSAFLQSEIRQQSNKVLPKWYEKVFYRAVCIVIALNTVSTTSAVANIVVDHRTYVPTLSTRLYTVGLIAAIGHMAFVPFVATPIQQMVEDSSQEGATAEMEKWLSFHRIRMAVADLPAWISFLGAFTSSTFF